MLEKTIHNKIEDQIQRQVYRGMTLALYQNGMWNEYYFGTYDGTHPVVPNLTYDLASVSKVIGVGTILIQLINEGVVKLDNPLQKYYPDFANQTLTIRDCLTHHSGIDPFIPNRNELNSQELIQAINQITVTDNKTFLYTDINFLLLGFMIEGLLKQDLATSINERVLKPFGMLETCYGPVNDAVPTVKGVKVGTVHDPKAKVLGHHAGSAGLFSKLPDLERFLEHYLQDDFAKNITHDYSNYSDKSRSLAWDLEDNWLGHTGYTGTYIAFNRKGQKAIIFLTNRTFDKDHRQDWIKERDELINIIKDSME